jgi:hypothetical protein
LIALLALARKVVILDVRDLTPPVVMSLGILAFALGATYWLTRESNREAPGGVVPASRES